MTSSTITRGDGTTTLTGPIGQEWVVMTIAGEEDNPAQLDDVAASLITIAAAEATADETIGPDAPDAAEFATLTLHDEVVVTLNGETITTERALELLSRGIVQAIATAVQNSPEAGVSTGEGADA